MIAALADVADVRRDRLQETAIVHAAWQPPNQNL